MTGGRKHKTSSKRRNDDVDGHSFSVSGALAGLLRWLPCVGRSTRLVSPVSADRRRPSATVDLPSLPLDERELFAVVRSWKAVQRDITETGMRMFLRMFEANPDLKRTFEKFRELDTPGEFRRSSVLQIHGMVVMSSLDEVITTMEEAIEEPFLLAVKETLGDGFTSRVENSYKKLIHYVLMLMVIGFRQTKQSLPDVHAAH